jgi:DnaJ-class molecular chaperone
MSNQNFYEILQVLRSASAKEIKAQYRKLAKSCHPDTNPGDPLAEANFKLLNTACETLSDPEKRYAYDAITFGTINPSSRQQNSSWQQVLAVIAVVIALFLIIAGLLRARKQGPVTD